MRTSFVAEAPVVDESAPEKVRNAVAVLAAAFPHANEFPVTDVSEHGYWVVTAAVNGEILESVTVDV
jgi:hypothetical protein